ncbi:TIGR02996 domain-containing protein [Gemmata sp. G18]|uniref:TIGR02996 domain-containing protein n=1 Tax=Gemmata palustris TaxID=2822762 RepID=A0ABS5BJ13_9BACT|nr:TIGR02996 domain-containing protein [Gemmata palustris]MBP3953684.1 TIGR02996 domain-containing protein [Gemmata palustris]
MNERSAFLTAIREQPGDDTPRLVFADWLDENAETDRDRATAEFIRVSCLGRNTASGFMPRQAYQWLGAEPEHAHAPGARNWMRLVPTVLARHVDRVVRPGPRGEPACDDVRWVRLGRVVYLTIRLPVSAEPVNAPGELRWYAMALTFTRGVLKSAAVSGHSAAYQLATALAVDQPMSRLVPKQQAREPWDLARGAA